MCAGSASIGAEVFERYVSEIVREELHGRLGRAALEENEPRLRALREAYRRDVALREQWESPEIQATVSPASYVKGLATRQENENRSLRVLLKAEEELVPSVAGYDLQDLIDNLQTRCRSRNGSRSTDR